MHEVISEIHEPMRCSAALRAINSKCQNPLSHRQVPQTYHLRSLGCRVGKVWKGVIILDVKPNTPAQPWAFRHLDLQARRMETIVATGMLGLPLPAPTRHTVMAILIAIVAIGTHDNYFYQTYVNVIPLLHQRQLSNIVPWLEFLTIPILASLSPTCYFSFCNTQYFFTFFIDAVHGLFSSYVHVFRHRGFIFPYCWYKDHHFFYWRREAWTWIRRA